MKQADLKHRSVRELIALLEGPETTEPEFFPLIEAELRSRSLHWEEVTDYAKVYWKDYFRRNMKMILTEQIELESQLIQEEEFRALFQEAFNEYRLRIKDMGIDDHRKFWIP